ncbi:hypothetical protein HIM_05865 [Hirsutella minnesotensis 3608]|uniref:DUF7907 domain-containing protein n=1 Tax=Hirsutella minnesotensis 3608 TaxID=1043627 RepID=A0A0F7ZUF0_9HYPO|nr:hypothetical protein HIM_05865 [Hirsutella minnesotensis 3608]
MKFAVVSGLLLGAIASAQDIQSKPFNLVIQSADKSLNGQKFAACHTGAAIESLCLAGRSGSNFYFNTTEGSQAPLAGYTPLGVVVWNLPLGGGPPNSVSEPLSLSSDPSSNVALPLLMPGYNQQYVAFDKKGQMAIMSYLDDTKSPPVSGNAKAFKNWFVCQTNYSGYRYRTLAWVHGTSKAKPQNPTCVKVEVQRKFV